MHVMMMTEQISRRMDRYLLIFIMLIAAYLRFDYLLQIEHNLDRAYPVWQALKTIHEGWLPLVGQGTSVLFANPTGMGYYYIPIILVTGSLLSLYVFVLGLNTLGVYFVYRAAHNLLGSKVALVAAALFAVNPWVLEYSRVIWQPSLIPFFMPLLMWLLSSLILGKTDHPKRTLFISFIVLGLMSQTALHTYFGVATVGLLILIFIRRMPKSAFFIGAGIFLLIQIPYAIGLIQSWDTVRSEVNEFSGQSAESRFHDDALRHAFRLVSGEDYELARGQDAPQNDSQQRHEITRWFASAVAILLAGGILISGLAILRPQNCNQPPDVPIEQARLASIILLIWFFLPIVTMSYNSSLVHPYYQLVGLPAGHILAAWGIVYVLVPYTPRRLALLIVLLIPFALIMGINHARHYQETQAHPGEHDLSALPLDWGLQLGESIRKNLPENGLVFADVDEWTLNSLAMRSFPVMRDTRAPDVTIVPASGGLYIVAYPPASDSSFIPDYAQRVDTLNLPDGWTITFDRFPSRGADLTDIQNYVNIRGEKWLSLMAYTTKQDGDTITVTTTWSVENLSPEIANFSFSPFIHVYDANGERVQIVDGRPIAGNLWQEGDVHVQRMSFTLDGDVSDYELQLGQYDGVAAQNIIFILPDGEYSAVIPLDG